ncbi:MAG: DUF3667 domain-containing protein [Bacteroidota bacterium]
MECRNCQQTLIASADFCHHCGAKVVQQRLNFARLFQEFWHVVTNVERGLWATMRDLLLQPAQVILGYLDGLRKKYTAPASFALIVGAIYSITALIYPDIYVHESMLEGVLLGGGGRPDWAESLMLKMIPWRLPLLFAPVLSISLLNWLAYRKQYNGAEHTVIGLYYFGQISLLYLGILLLIEGISQMTGSNNIVQLSGLALFLLVTLWYKLRVYRACYRHTKAWKATLKPILLFLVGFLINMIPYFFVIALYLDESS